MMMLYQIRFANVDAPAVHKGQARSEPCIYSSLTPDISGSWKALRDNHGNLDRCARMCLHFVYCDSMGLVAMVSNESTAYINYASGIKRSIVLCIVKLLHSPRVMLYFFKFN